MKKILLLCLLSALTTVRRAHADQLTGAPPDTVAGENRLVKLFALGICEQIAMESRHQDLAVLTREQGMGLLQEMLTAVIIRDSAEFRAFVVRAPDANAAVQRVSIQAVLRLGNACPSASKLLVKMGVQMSGMDTTLTAAQGQATRVAAQEICRRLAAADGAHPLSQRSAPERIALYRSAMQRMVLVQRPALVAAFGDDVFTNEQLEDKLWTNIDRLMFDQCSGIAGVLRVDLGLERLRAREAAESTVPTTAPVPAQRNKKAPLHR